MYRAADEGVVGPFIVVDAVVRHGVVEEPLALVHGVDGGAELELGVVGLAESDGEGVAYGEDVRGVVRLGGVAVDIVVEALVGGLLDITPVGVVGLEDMTESHKGYIVHAYGVYLRAPSVDDGFDRVVVSVLFGDGVLVMKVSAEVTVARHDTFSAEAHRQVLATEAAVELFDVLQTAVVEGVEPAPAEGGVHAVVGAGVTAPNGAAEQLAGCVFVVSDGAEVVHLEAEIKASADVTGEEEVDVVLFVSGDKTFLVGYGGERNGGVEVPLFLGGDDVRREAVGERVLDGLLTVLYDTRLDGRDEDVSVHGAAERVELLDIYVVVVEHDSVPEGDGVRYGAERRHLPGLDHRADTRLLGSGHKGRCQQH